MDNSKPQRRFQFSLRKLMLWMVVWAVYLTFFWRLVVISLAVLVTTYLVVIAAIRMKWGLKPGLKIAAVNMGIVWGCLGPLPFVAGGVASPAIGLLLFVCCFVIGLVSGSIAFVLIELLVRCVNSLDELIETKTQSH